MAIASTRHGQLRGRDTGARHSPMKADVPAPVRMTRVAARSSNGRKKRLQRVLASAASNACVLRSIAGCCAISRAVQSAPSARARSSSPAELRHCDGTFGGDSRRMIAVEHRPSHAPLPARPGRSRCGPSLYAA